jgi:CDP-diacylglycerol--serine O-phosphatidyltransferase
VNIFRTVKVADIFTVGNLSCGVISIFAAASDHFGLAAALMVSALVMDTFDGKVAKWMHQANAFGKQLDSLADLISFGVAPAAFYYCLRDPGVSSSLILVLFTICGMLRLARYNISDAEGFEGVPITVNGFVFPLLYLIYLFHPASLSVWPATYATMSVLMVSSLRFKRIV